ncbi:MAG TPA: VWA domain-containing protein [Candidatus Sulfotelmatobacter sp.]|nr:VWA domain-containing protein [Candidatus Sulfotelmatobacter sp.]
MERFAMDVSQIPGFNHSSGDHQFRFPFFAPVIATALIFLLSPSLVAQQTAKVPVDNNVIHLDVVVTPRSGPPVRGLEEKDFTVLDNKVPVKITSFQALRGRDAPVKILIVIDDVNTGFRRIAYERQEIGKVLNLDSGNLRHPTALAVFTDSGTQIQDEFTQDGKVLGTTLDQYTIGIHTIPRSGGVYAAQERYQLSIAALQQIAERELTLPGRKIVLWISPGWPLLSGASNYSTSKQEQEVFDAITTLSTLLRQARITLYSIDPLGTDDFNRAFNWKAYLKPVSSPYQAEYGNLALQVLAVQSGGLVLTNRNDLAEMLRLCLADIQSYYEMSCSVPNSGKKDAYHHLEVRVAKPDVTARTREGYYSPVGTDGKNH